MENILVFGTFNMPIDINLPASYTCPSILPRDVMDRISFIDDQQEYQDNEVTHTVFFGENIKRVSKAILGK